MKPREFDELIRRKFEQDDFEYNPRNWDQLTEQMDGRAKKRSIALWWWMPLAAGMAASVALAIGVVSMRQGDTGNAGVAGFAQAFRYEQNQHVQPSQDALQYSVNPEAQYAKTNHRRNNAGKVVMNAEKGTDFGINLDNAISLARATKQQKFDFLGITTDKPDKEKDKKKDVAVAEGYHTFKPEEIQKAPKVSITLLGGYNQGSQNIGYVAGATVRRMVNDKVYVESDVAFASSNNTQPTWVAGPDVSARHGVAARTTNALSSKTNTVTPVDEPIEESQTYNLSYAQVSPSLGYKLMKRMSLAAGPDFQQALADNRPAPATDLTHDNVAVMPLFDVGFIGKTEYSVTKKVKAQLSYRKGINNLLTPMDKYIDRDYLQVQVRYTIFNK